MSSSGIAVSVRGLSKSYTIAHNVEKHITMAETVLERAKTAFKRVEQETFWALKDVSFDVRHGDVVGIIGRNGAGKSTLLKVLSEITEPTTGEVRLYGRVGSLLEVGTGFHPELTGRENIFLNGAILGMTRAQITAQFDEIVDFAGVESFLDTPVKRYSSGMYVRLAFAVAAHLNPEILIVDEVLAVGDTEFQKKCLGKMQDVATREGRTVLFVSHNMTAVQSLCRGVICLHQGRIVDQGPTRETVSRYLNTNALSTEAVFPNIESAPGNEEVRFRKMSIRPVDGHAWDLITVRTPVVLEFEFWNLDPGAYLNVSVHVYNSDGIFIFNSGPVREPNWHGKPFPTGLYKTTCSIPGDFLNTGLHRVHVFAVRNQNRVIFDIEDALVFDVADSTELRGPYHGEWLGAVRPDFDWLTEQIDADAATLTH